MVTFGSLFAGIGGFDLGFERAGLDCRWQVEINEFCQKILAKHWPSVRRWPDVCTWPQSDAERVDVICGGFPCQDISAAGHGDGLDGERSGLWREYRRCIGVLLPRIVVVENSPALTFRGLGSVLGDLAALGFDAEWHCIPAANFGAAHERDRIWIIAHAKSERRGSWGARRFADRLPWVQDEARWNPSDTECVQGSERYGAAMQRGRAGEAEQTGLGVRPTWWRNRWPDEPALCRVDDGVPCRMDRIRSVGNAVCPQITEWIARRILEMDSEAAA